jgi:hypothetical protein
MNRKISEKNVEIIKVMLSKGYSNASIRDEMSIKYKQPIDSATLQSIKKGEAYVDVRSDLNEKILLNYGSKVKDIETIHDIKWALANGYNEIEILKNYEVSSKKLLKIKLLQAPYINISPEYNDEIRLLYRRRKKANIDKRMVIEIKKQYVLSKGNANLSEIGDSFKVDKATISNIINLKAYTHYGISFNQKITAIKNIIANEKKNREALKLKLKIHRSKISELQKKKNQIADLIRRERQKSVELNQ